jgi:hypothetical protein
MAGLTTAEKNSMLAKLAADAPFLSLHSADPGATGTNELTGGSPAYARKAASWGTPAGGAMSPSAYPTFDIPAGSTVAYVGYWSAASAGTFCGSRPLSASETFTGQGTYTPSSIVENLT